MSALSLHRFLFRLSNATVNAFLWIFVFLYFFSEGHSPAFSLTETLLLYALSQAMCVLAIPWMLMYARGSMLRGVVFGTLAWAAALIYTGMLASGYFPHGAAAIGILFGLYRALYRVSYAMELRELEPRRAVSLSGELALAGVPLVAGIALSSGFGFAAIMFLAALITVLALIPLPFVPNVVEEYQWTYHGTFMQLVDNRNRMLVYDAVIHGAKAAALFVLWPLALLLLGVPSPALLGGIFSVTLIAFLLFKSEGRRTFVEQHADSGTYVDEYTALKEIGQSTGRMLVCLILAILVSIY